MTVTVHTPPTPYKPTKEGAVSVFLAGSIEMGGARDWQSDAIDMMRAMRVIGDIDVLNPRRDDWDSSWVQSVENPQFKEQVEWELNGLENNSDIVLMHFEESSKSPITLLEFGLLYEGIVRLPEYEKGYLIVSCPMKFWRRGNIEVMINRLFSPRALLVSNLHEALEHLPHRIQKVRHQMR